VPATERDVELIRSMYDTFIDRFERIAAGDVDEFYAAHYAPDAVMESPDAFPAPTHFEGLEGYRTLVQESYGAYEDVEWQLEDVQAVADSVVVRALIRGRAKGDPVLIEVRVAFAYEMRDGLICRSRLYLSHERALAGARGDG
jgi:ketosteroid isomerase-like protein